MGGERETLPNPPLTPVSGEESHLQSLGGIIFREGVRKPAPAKRCTLKGRLKMINMGKNRNEPHGHTSAEHRAVFTCKRSKIPYRTLGKHKTRRLGVQEQEQDAGRMFNCEFQENVLFNLCNLQSVSYLLGPSVPLSFSCALATQESHKCRRRCRCVCACHRHTCRELHQEAATSNYQAILNKMMLLLLLF